MANTQVNRQVLDSVLSVNEIVLGSSAASSMATMYTNLAQSAGMASQNAVVNQQHLNILASATIAAGSNCVLQSAQKPQLELLSPTEKLDYLQKLIKLAENATAPATPPATTTATPAATAATTDSEDSSTNDADNAAQSGDAVAS